MIRIQVVSATRFNVMALIQDQLQDSTDSIEDYHVSAVVDGAGKRLALSSHLRQDDNETRPGDVTTEIHFGGGSIHLTINKETGNASLTSNLKDGYADLHLEVDVFTTNHNRRPAPNLPMGLNGEFIQFPAEWDGVPPVELPEWAVKRGEEFLREYVKRVHNPSEEKTEWILSVDSKFANEFMGFVHGVNNGVSLEDFVKLGAGHFSFRQRAQLENDPEQRHLINYDVIIQHGENDELEILLYERTKFSGEQRLANGRSIGIGGHIEKFDAIYHDMDQNHPDILETIRTGVFRERMEELVLISRDGYSVPEHVKQAILTNPDATRFSGFLCDNEDPKRTGTFHLGIVSFVLLPRGIRAETRGASDLFVGCYPLAKIMEEPTLERWSRIVGEYLKNDDFHDLVGVKQLELRPAGVAPVEEDSNMEKLPTDLGEREVLSFKGDETHSEFEVYVPIKQGTALPTSPLGLVLGLPEVHALGFPTILSMTDEVHVTKLVLVGDEQVTTVPFEDRYLTGEVNNEVCDVHATLTPAGVLLGDVVGMVIAGNIIDHDKPGQFTRISRHPLTSMGVRAAAAALTK